MIARALLLADGPSDEPLGGHVAALALAHGVKLDIVTPDFARMRPSPGRTVEARLMRMLAADDQFDLLIVHRDAEGADPGHRHDEVNSACLECGVDWPTIPVVPIRMTEAWLLLDESAIRTVAGRPGSSVALDLPRADQVESIADPKALLQSALATASGCSGRRLRQFNRDFGHHRRQLLERLDPAGPVQRLSAWQRLRATVAEALGAMRT